METTYRLDSAELEVACKESKVSSVFLQQYDAGDRYHDYRIQATVKVQE